jgi:hypothetical protein
MKCPSCNGSGDGGAGKPCLICNGSGRTCDTCGEKCPAGTDICAYCESHQNDE